MSGLRAKVRNGRLTLDEPTSLPDGTTLDLVVDDEGDELSEQERRSLNEAISRAWNSAKLGRLRSSVELIDELRQDR